MQSLHIHTRTLSLSTDLRPTSPNLLNPIPDRLLTIPRSATTNTSHPLRRMANRIVQAGLAREMQALLSGGATTDDGLVAVEVFGDFLERGVAGLDVEEVDDGELDAEPDAVEDVVFPGEVVEGDRVDVLVEEDWRAERNVSWGKLDWGIWDMGTYD